MAEDKLKLVTSERRGMEETEKQQSKGTEIRSVIREALSEFIRLEQARTEPAYKTELVEERKKRESLERTVRDLVEENRKSRQMAEELERSSSIRSELQRLGVTKVDLAYKAIKDDIKRTEDGRLVAATEQGEVSAKEYLSRFVNENPELLPVRVSADGRE